MNYISFFAMALVPAAILALLIRAQFRSVVIYEWDTGLLYENGRFKETLPPGRHWLVKTMKEVEVITVRTGEQAGASGLVYVSSAERLPFRMSAWFVYKVTDARRFHERTGYAELARAFATSLVEIAAAYKLEDLLAARAEAGSRLIELTAPKLSDCELVLAQIDAIQMPPETRRLFIEIEKARLEGLAALERARGEQAALRSLANAARLLKDNPELANLRLLQSVSGSQKGSTTIVLGQGALAGYTAETRPE